jgi:hypothetical protein
VSFSVTINIKGVLEMASHWESSQIIVLELEFESVDNPIHLQNAWIQF